MAFIPESDGNDPDSEPLNRRHSVGQTFISLRPVVKSAIAVADALNVPLSRQ